MGRFSLLAVAVVGALALFAAAGAERASANCLAVGGLFSFGTGCVATNGGVAVGIGNGARGIGCFGGVSVACDGKIATAIGTVDVKCP